MRLFIAEDEAIIRLGLKEMAVSLGHQVVGSAAHGQRVYEKVKQTQPDLLLLDIRMPGIDGLTVAAQLYQEMPLPIVILTAYTDLDLVGVAAEIPVVGYLVKPIHEGKLAPMLHLAMERFHNLQTTDYRVTKDDLVMYLM